MISGQWFYRRKIKNWPKIAQNYPLFHKNRGSTSNLITVVGVHPRNIHNKFGANPCSGSREKAEKLKKFAPPTTTTTDTG